MNQLLAKSIIKNKFWVVENQGNQIATIQAIENGGYAFVSNEERQRFPSIKLLSKEYNIRFEKSNISKSKKNKTLNEIYGFPITGSAYNILWNVKYNFPVYTKSNKSKSFYCAGYYLIKYNENGWLQQFCPKLISVSRYEFKGPFKTKEAMLKELYKPNV